MKILSGNRNMSYADFCFHAPMNMDDRLYNKSLGGGATLDVGIYPVSFATLILGEPAIVKSVAKIASTGIDEYANMILQYPGGETAQLLCGITFNSGIEAEIIGTKGSIKIKNPWFKATDFSVKLNDGGTEDFSIPHLCNGFEHEIKEVMDCLDKGLLQSNRFPHHVTLTVSKILDEVLKQAGVSY